MQVMNQYEQGPLTEKSECLYISREGKRYQENTRILREQKIDIIINEKLILHTMCTPQYLTEAVLGRLRTEGIIEKVDEIEKIHIGNDGKIATITMKNDAWNEKQCKKLSPVSPVKWKEEWIFHLADILAEKGLQATRDETFNTLIPKVRDIGGSEYEGTILNIPFLPKSIENFSVGTAEEFEITEV